MIKKCSKCGDKPHTQDELHGRGNRVFNETRQGEWNVKRCTVCGHEEKTPAKNPNGK